MGDRLWTGTTNTTFSTNTNWYGNTAPSNSGDTALFDFNAVNSVSGSDQSAITLTRLDVTSTYANYAVGTQGSPLIIKATAANIGAASGGLTGAHSGRINLDMNNAASTITVYGTKSASSSTDAALEPVRIKCNNTSTKLIVYSGTVGVATDALGDTATLGEISVLGQQAKVNIASGTTINTAIKMSVGGVVNLFTSCPSIINDAGTINTYGSGAVSTSLQVSGAANLNSNGTIAELQVFSSGSANFLGDTRAKTVTTIKLYSGATLSYDPAVVTVSNPIQLIGCGLDDVNINVPNNCTVAIVAT